jgi:hypothetical protein
MTAVYCAASLSCWEIMKNHRESAKRLFKTFIISGTRSVHMYHRRCWIIYIRTRERLGKVVPVLPLTEHHAMKAQWGSGGTAPPIL